jgi:hypothetical protein
LDPDALVQKIGGYGTFVRYLDAAAKEAWQLYGVNNGVDSEVELVAKISRLAPSLEAIKDRNENEYRD